MYREDLIGRTLELLKFYALANCAAFHDARLAAAHRPRLLAAGGERHDPPQHSMKGIRNKAPKTLAPAVPREE